MSGTVTPAVPETPAVQATPIAAPPAAPLPVAGASPEPAAGTQPPGGDAPATPPAALSSPEVPPSLMATPPPEPAQPAEAAAEAPPPAPAEPLPLPAYDPFVLPDGVSLDAGARLNSPIRLPKPRIRASQLIRQSRTRSCRRWGRRCSISISKRARTSKRHSARSLNQTHPRRNDPGQSENLDRQLRQGWVSRAEGGPRTGRRPNGRHHAAGAGSEASISMAAKLVPIASVHCATL